MKDFKSVIYKQSGCFSELQHSVKMEKEVAKGRVELRVDGLMDRKKEKLSTV
jgi:hypothetical protein